MIRSRSMSMDLIVISEVSCKKKQRVWYKQLCKMIT